MADNRPVLSKTQWQQVEVDYKSGNWKSVTELAQKYGLKVATLSAAIHRNEWDVYREKTSLKVSQSVEKKALSEVDSWVNRVKDRTLKDWNLIDKSLDTVASSSGEVDPETLLPYIRGRKILDDMHRRALGMADPSQGLDITSKGQSLGESLISAIAKAREGNSPQLTEADVDKILEAEIVEDDDSEPKT